MAKIQINLSSEVYTKEQLESLLKDFALATGWQETTHAVEKNDDGTIKLGDDGIPVYKFDKDGNPELEANPSKPLDFVPAPVRAYFRETLVAYQQNKAKAAAVKAASDQTNAALDGITLTVGVE